MLDISPFFSESFYLAENPDVAAAVSAGGFSSGLEHYNSSGKFEGRNPSLLFDNNFYLQQNSDVAVAVSAGVFRSSFEHYELFGQFENRNPSRLFDSRDYLEKNPDVAAAVAQSDELTGIVHYLNFGQFEGRTSSDLFDESFYLQQNPDVAAAVATIDSLTGLKHFLNFGYAEGRNSSTSFNNSFYLEQYSDIAAAVSTGSIRSGFLHYIKFGIAEQRFGNDVFGNLTAIYVSNNGASNVGDVDRLNPDFTGSKRFVAGNNEGVELDISGNLYQAGDITPGAGTIRTISKIGSRPEGDVFSIVRDRQLGGPLTGLVNPKGIAIAQTAGFTIVADNGAQNLKVFGTATGGNVPPVAITALPANPWDATYDEKSDRLFVALVNGTIAIFDNYIASNFGASGLSRLVTPVNASDAKVSTNLHGIVYSPVRDKLVVTDVGAATMMQSPSFNADGRLYVIDNASTANGNVVPSRAIEGSNTLLGNPVDLILNGSEVRVAEKAKDRLLIFRNIFNGSSGNIAPDVSVADTKPESLVAALSQKSTNPDVTDIELTSTLINSIAVTSNPPTMGSNEFVARLSTNLQTTQSTFNTSNLVPTVENITFDQAGDAFITFDDGTDKNGGILIVNRLAESRNGEAGTIVRDRSITGVNTGLVSPKGLDIADNLGLVFVAENNATTPAILAFSTQAQGDVAPAFRTTNLGGRRPWDVDYEPTSDRLFVAATDGTVLIYDQYTANQGANGPTRAITPFAGGKKVSVNLHGIIYAQSTDTLLLSDVGSAMNATDGQLFVVNNASSANGNVDVRGIAGANTKLGNPVDITYDGANLYVAEKSNNLIMRYDNLLNQLALIDPLPGQPPIFDLPASLTVTRNKPESVALAPDYLSSGLI